MKESGTACPDSLNERAANTALFVFAHPDDELVQAGCVIASHVAAGHDVHVVMMTVGNKVGYRSLRLPAKLGYTPSEEEIGERRIAEFHETCRRLGVGIMNRHVYNNGDGQVTRAHTKAVVRAFLQEHPGASVKGHSFIDAHPDHRNIGKALDEMHAAGEIADLQFFLSRRYVDLIPFPRGGRQTEPDVSAAIWAYKHEDLESLWFAIGWNSNMELFSDWEKNPYSLFHVPSQTNGVSGWRSEEDRIAAEAWVASKGGYT